jgi:hypothetical protein
MNLTSVSPHLVLCQEFLHLLSPVTLSRILAGAFLSAKDLKRAHLYDNMLRQLIDDNLLALQPQRQLQIRLQRHDIPFDAP